METTIGFAGMGIMGSAMAANLLKAGFDVTVYNRTRSKTQPLAGAGAKVADDPGGLARAVDVVVFMVTDPQAVDDLLDGGVLDNLGPGKVLVNMSTVSPEYARSAAERVTASGAGYVDAPVAGSKKPATDGTLVILAGGPDELVDRVQPAFEAMGKKVVRCGKAGQGSAMKMVVNSLLAVKLQALAEAVNLGRRCGLDQQAILDFVLAGPLGCGLYEVKRPMLESGDYPTQFPLKHMLKDLGLVLDTASQVGARMPLSSAAQATYFGARQSGLGDKDFAAVMEVIERETPQTGKATGED